MASLASLPNELLYQCINFILSSDETHICVPATDECATSSWGSINALAQTCRHFLTIINPILYGHSAKQCHAAHSCLYWATLHGRLDTIKTAFRHGADIDRALIVSGTANWPGPGTGKMLALAVSRGHLEIVEYLLQKGADVHCPWRGSSTGICGCFDCLPTTSYPLHIAMGAYREDNDRSERLVRLLVQYGAYLTGVKRTAIASLVENGLYSIIDIMLPRIHKDSELTMELLFAAVQQGSMSYLPTILQLPNANVSQAWARGDTAMHLAVDRGDLNIFRLLLNRPESDVNARGFMEWYLLHKVVKAGLPMDWLASLLEHPDIDINAEDQSQTTAFFYAARASDLANLELLMAHPDIDVNKRGAGGYTPIQGALAECNRAKLSLRARFDILKRLLTDPRADVCGKPVYGQSALRMLSISDKKDQEYIIELIQILLDRGVSIDEQDPRGGGTALSSSIDVGNLDVALFLLERGADPLLNTVQYGPHNRLLANTLRSDSTVSQQLLLKELLLRGVPLDETTDPIARGPIVRYYYRYADSYSDEGTALFFAAVAARSTHAVACLLAAGADPNSLVIHHVKHKACETRQAQEGCGDWHKRKAYTKKTQRRCGPRHWFKECGKRQRQPLLYAVLRRLWSGTTTDDDVVSNRRDIVKLLVEAGAYIGEGGTGNRYSALHLASSYDEDAGPNGLLRLLLDNITVAQVGYNHVRSLALHHMQLKADIKTNEKTKEKKIGKHIRTRAETKAQAEAEALLKEGKAQPKAEAQGNPKIRIRLRAEGEIDLTGRLRLNIARVLMEFAIQRFPNEFQGDEIWQEVKLRLSNTRQ